MHNDDISLSLAKAKLTGGFPDIRAEELTVLTQAAKRLFSDDTAFKQSFGSVLLQNANRNSNFGSVGTLAAMASPPTNTLTKTTTSGITSPISISASNAAFRFTGYGYVNINSSGYWGSQVANGTASLIEFMSDASQLDIKMIGLNTKAILYIDGVRVDNVGVSTDVSGGGYLWNINPGSAIPRHYKLFAINGGFGGLNLSAGASVWYPNLNTRPLIYGLGDSYMFGTNASTVAQSGFHGMCNLLGFDGLPAGIGGTGWTTAGANEPIARIQQAISYLTRTPDIVCFDLGYNDAGGNMATITSEIAGCVSLIQSAWPSAKIIGFGPATPLGDTANLLTVRSTVQSAFAANGVDFVDAQGWISATNSGAYTGGDNIHPTQAGYDYLAVRKAHAITPFLF